MLDRGDGSNQVCCEVSHLEQALKDAQLHGCLLDRPLSQAGAFQQLHIASLNTPARQLVEVVESGK